LVAKSNSEVVREALDLYHREGFEALTPFADPQIEVYAAPGLLNAGEFKGMDEAVAFNAEWEEAWADATYVPDELIEVDGENVVAVIKSKVRGRGSGVEVDATQYWLFGIRDGLIVRWHLYTDRESAVAAAEVGD
jgi:ketosteroid isomerase-like protein